MNRKAIVFGIIVIGATVYYVFFHTWTCVSAAYNRNNIPYKIGICPPFVETRVEDVKAEFEKRVAVGDGAEIIETALKEMGLTFTWDRFQNKYNAIIRHPSSNFHAITIKVFVYEKRKFKEIRVRDSFTAL